MTASPAVSTGAIIFLRPIKKTIQASIADAHIIPASGMIFCALKEPTAIEASAPIPSCIKPSKAEAVPAFRANGAIDKAAVLGLATPTQHNCRNNITIIPGKPSQLLTEPIKKIVAKINWQINVTGTICSPLNFLISKLFT